MSLELLGLRLADEIREAVEKPVADDRDVDPLVAAEVSAVIRVAVARVADHEATVDRRAARVPEAGATTGARVVLVPVQLQDLWRQLLSDLGREPPNDRLPLRQSASAGRSPPCVGPRCRSRSPGTPSCSGSAARTRRGSSRARAAWSGSRRCLVQDHDARVVPVLDVGEVAVVRVRPVASRVPTSARPRRRAP